MLKITGREFLYSLNTIDKELTDKLEKLEMLRTMAIKITACTDKEAVQSNGSQDKLGNIMAKIVDMENEINEHTDNYCKRKEIAKDLIFKIEKESYQNMLYDLFICHIPLYQVAENYELTYKGAETTRRKAIVEFDKLFKDKYNNEIYI